MKGARNLTIVNIQRRTVPRARTILKCTEDAGTITPTSISHQPALQQCWNEEKNNRRSKGTTSEVPVVERIDAGDGDMQY